MARVVKEKNSADASQIARANAVFERIMLAFGSKRPREVERIMGWSSNSMRYWELEGGYPKTEALLQIRQHTQANIDWLLTGQGPTGIEGIDGLTTSAEIPIVGVVVSDSEDAERSCVYEKPRCRSMDASAAAWSISGCCAMPIGVDGDTVLTAAPIEGEPTSGITCVVVVLDKITRRVTGAYLGRILYADGVVNVMPIASHCHFSIGPFLLVHCEIYPVIGALWASR